MPGTFYAIFTQLLQTYTDLHCTWCDNIILKQVYSGGVRTSQESSEIIRKHQEGLGNTRPGRATILGWEGRLCRKSRLGRETRLGRKTSLGFEGRLYTLQKEQAGQGHQPWLGRESRLSRETSLWWEGRLCREGWLGIAYSDRYIHQFNPTSPASSFMMLPDLS